MKNYINKGGDALKKLNNTVAEKLDNMELSEKARDIIAQTDINIMAETFGGLENAEDVERYIFENYGELYYIADNNGTVHGEARDYYGAELMLDDIKSAMEADGKSAEEIDALELEIGVEF